jgi:hypothetical protein
VKKNDTVWSRALRSVSYTSLSRIVIPIWERQLAGERGLPAIEVQGKPGAGKSACIREIADRLGVRNVLTLSAPQLTPSDFSLPVPVDGELRLLLLSFLHALTVTGDADARARWIGLRERGLVTGEYAGPGRTIIILEELSLARGDMQGALHALTLDLAVGATQEPLLPGVIVVAISNNEEDSPYVTRLAAPLRNRMLRLRFEPDAEEWLGEAERFGVRPEVRAFLRADHSWLMRYDAKVDPDAFPSPRSWTLFSRVLEVLLGAGVGQGDIEVTGQGLIGAEATTAFLAFFSRAVSVPSAAEIAAAPETTDACMGRLDAAWVAVENMLSTVNAHPHWMAAFLTYARRLDPLPRDYLLERLLKNADQTLEAAAVHAMLDHVETPDGMELLVEHASLPKQPQVLS